MRPSAPRLILVSLLSVGTFIAACGGDSSSPPIPNYTLDGSVAPPADGGGDDSSVVDEDAADAADATPVVCPDVSPDDATGVFVATTGTGGAACGTRATPCKTVTQGMARAAAASKAQVNIAQGTYTEQVTLAAGLELVGGWSVTAGAWKRACTTPGQITILKAPAVQNTTVTATELGGEAKLTLLRIESKAAASVVPGESIYGIFATGMSTILTLKDVTVDVVAAGAGGSPAKAADGTPAAGTCATGTAVAGTPGPAGPGALGGSFGAAGYTPSSASAGAAGNPGTNGLAGAAAACITCGTCAPYTDPIAPCSFTADAAQTCGTNGKSGCGGNPGQAGQPGTGGGSSVGIYTWDATVTSTGGAVKSGDGGNGAAGGAGGAGGGGSVGTKGAAAAACIPMGVNGCGAPDLINLVCAPNKTEVAAGGTIGGTGAAGGAGGAGGGGGGGSSYATYQGSAAVITFTGTTYAHGKAGAGGGAGTSAGTAGTAADHYP